MTGRADYLKLGTWNANCDRCTFKFKASDLRKTWDNLYVCPSCWESRHPADFFRAKEDNTSVPWTNPDAEIDAGDYVEPDYYDLSLGGYTNTGDV